MAARSDQDPRAAAARWAAASGQWWVPRQVRLPPVEEDRAEEQERRLPASMSLASPAARPVAEPSGLTAPQAPGREWELEQTRPRSKPAAQPWLPDLRLQDLRLQDLLE